MYKHIRFIGTVVVLVTMFIGLFASRSQARTADVIEDVGTALSIGLPVVAGGMTLAHDDGKGRWQLAESELATIGVTYGLKSVIDETRPDGGSGSFPSLHTSVSFAAADFIRKRYGWEYGGPALALAGFVGYSRVEADRHYVRDVLAGAAIGILASELLTTLNDHVRVSVVGSADAVGINIAGSW